MLVGAAPCFCVGIPFCLVGDVVAEAAKLTSKGDVSDEIQRDFCALPISWIMECINDKTCRAGKRPTYQHQLS